MTRIKISFGILGILIGFSIFFSVWINKKCNYMLDEISNIYQLLENGETSLATQHAEMLDNKWSNFRKTATIMIKNNELTDIDCISAGIPNLIKNDNDESYARLMEFQHLLIMIKENEIPTITRVL